eukprot:1136338-Pelagomonas_calceolata.AAC.5
MMYQPQCTAAVRAHSTHTCIAPPDLPHVPKPFRTNGIPHALSCLILLYPWSPMPVRSRRDACVRKVKCRPGSRLVS